MVLVLVLLTLVGYSSFDHRLVLVLVVAPFSYVLWWCALRNGHIVTIISQKNTGRSTGRREKITSAGGREKNTGRSADRREKITSAGGREKIAGGREKIEAQAEERRMQMQLEERKLAVQAEEKRLALEAQERMRLEDRKLEQQKLEIQLKKIEMGNFTDMDEIGENIGRGKDSFKFAAAMKFVPKFQSSDVEHYLIAFEKAMALHKIPNEKWTALLHPQLTGKAQKVFSELSIEECSDYEIVKRALLTAYERVPEFYRKRFRNMGKEKLETYSNYAFRMQLPFQRWLEGEGAVED